MALTTYFKGLAMGTADVIPGVSGGTIAFITNIYTKLIDEIKHLTTPPTTSEEIKQYFNNIDYTFLTTLLAGIATAMLILGHAITALLQTYSGHVYAYFTGLILLSAVYIYKDVDNYTATWDNLLYGILTGIVITGVEVAAPSTSLPYLFISGTLAITAMILPGISGAFILVILQQYETVLNLLTTFNIPRLTIFGLGALTGLTLLTHPLQRWLHNDRDVALTFLTGLMLGSLKLLLHRTQLINPTMLLAAILGALTVALPHHYQTA